VRIALVVVLASCGRFGFAGIEDAQDTAHDTAGLCVDGDGICLVSCVAMDSDCVTTCGDGRCVGNAGEYCHDCAADCMTLDPVCGNGACDPGEAPDCYADCGPSPWTWTADEQELRDMLNAARVNGTMCPGAPLRTAPMFVDDTSLELGAREWSWEIVHQGPPAAGRCNGRTIGDVILAVSGGSSGYVWIANVPTAADTVAFFLGTQNICNSIMSNTFMRIGAGVARDNGNRFTIIIAP
jgi:hypothetical protein